MLDARVKIAALFVFSIAIFFVNSWLVFGVFVVLVATAMVVSLVKGQATPREYLVPLVPVIVLALFAFGFGVWNNPTLEGISNAGIIALRMIILVLASFVVCYTTTSTQLICAFKWFLSPFRYIHVPVKDVSFVLTLALRFIPQIAIEYNEVRLAQNCRGADRPGLAMKRHLSNASATFIAVFIGLFRQADNIATAMDARCYGLSVPKELLLERPEDAT